MVPRRRPRSDNHRFRGDVERDLYVSTFKYRPIIVERGITLRDFPAVEQYFQHVGWTDYAAYTGSPGQFHESALGELVREFYVNMHMIDLSLGVLHSYVRSVNIELTPSVISQFLHIPRPDHVDFEPVLDTNGPSVQTIARVLTEGRVDWVGETIAHRHLTEVNRMLHLYVANSIDPSFHITNVSERRGRIVHSIVTGRVFDLPLFMFQQIAASHDSTSRTDSLPFGLFITHYLLSLGVEVPRNYQMIQMPNPLDHVSVRRSRSHSRPTPVPTRNPSRPISPRPSSSAPGPSSSAPGPSSSTPPAYDLDMIGAMLASIQGENRQFQDTVYQRFSAIDARQTEFQTIQTAMDSRLQAMQVRQDEMQLTLTQIQQNLNTYSFDFGPPFGDDFFPDMGAPPGEDGDDGGAAGAGA